MPKIAATRFGAIMRGDADNKQKAVLEVIFLAGTEYKNFKADIQVMNARSVSETRDDIVDQLTDILATKFPGEAWSARDILLYGF